MASVATTLDDPCVLTCLVPPDRLLCVLFGRDGEVSPSWVTLSETAQSCGHCMSQDFNGVIVFFGKKGYKIINIKEGAIATDAAAISHSAKSYSSLLFVKDWCLFCDTDSFYVSDTARRSTGDFLQSKAKVNVSSEIGPQNRLLLSNDKSVVREMHKVNTKATDIIIVTTNPTTGLCSIHWATPELPSTMNLKWSLALAQDRVVIASNTLPMSSANSECIPWACIIVASTLKVLTRSGVLGCVDLSTSCPAVVGAVVLSTTDAHSATSTSNASVDESAVPTTATVLLSCVGDRYFALTIQTTTVSCHPVSISERFFLLPTETSCARINSADAVRQTRTMLPCCETLVRIPCAWLQGETNNHNTECVILLGFHAHFGVQLIIEDSAVPHLSADETTKLVNAADKVQNTFFRNHQSISLRPKDLENVDDTKRWLTSNFCARTQQAAVYKLSQNKVRLETSARFELDAESFYNDTQVHMVYPTRTDPETPHLVMLSSRQAQQSSVYSITLRDKDKQYGSLSPLSQALYQSEESSLGLFALKDCVAQVTSCGLYVWNNDNYKIHMSWSQLLQEVVAKGMRITTVNQAGSRTEIPFTSDKAARFRPQFAISVSATCLVAVCEDMLVHVKVCTTVGNTFLLSVLHIVQLHAAVCGITSEPTQDGDQGLLFVSYWPDSQKGSVTSGNDDSVHILSCSESTGIHYMHQVEHIAHGLAHRPLRHLSTISLYRSSAVQLFALLCAHPNGESALYHVLYKVRDNTVEHVLVRTLSLAGGVEAVVTFASSTHHSFLVSSAACEYAVTAGLISAELDVLNIKDLCAVASWRCNETSSHKGTNRISFTSTATITPAGSKINPVDWIELTHSFNEQSDRPALAQHPALCFGFIHTDKMMLDHAEDRLFFPGQVVSLDTSSSKRRFVVLSADHAADDSLIGDAPALVAQQAAVRQGEVSLYDTESFACVWRQRLTSTDLSMPLLGMVAGPETPTSLIPPCVMSTTVSLVHGHVLSDVVSGPSAVLSAVSLTTLQITEESDEPAQVTPIGSIRIFVDIRRLFQTPPVVESSTTTATAVPPPEPRLEGFINNSLHCRALAECVVLCLPGNTLSLVGWSNRDDHVEQSVKLVEHMRIDLQDKNAAVLEMVQVGSSHVVLSLALVGLEIYSLIPGSSSEAPLLQFTHSISNSGCLWSELCVKEFGYDEHTGDTSAILTVHDKMKDTAHEISLFLPSPQSMLTGSVLNCQVKPAPPLRI